MPHRIAHIFSKLFSAKTLHFSVCLILLFSLIPLQFAQAITAEEAGKCMALGPGLGGTCILGNLLGIGNVFSNAIVNGLAAAVDVLVGSIAIVMKAINESIASVLETAIEAFINTPTSPNNPGTPTAIITAWTIARNLVNVIFILILTFIGLATILRLQNYQLQKTLPSLIITALLVNFSGVFVGFIADIGNIITRTFLNADDGGFPGIWTSGDIPVIQGAAGLGTHVVSLLYYTISTLVYFIVLLLFGVRTVILWLLTILSPMAFAARILPGTQKYWTQWLQQLIQWSILGIPISFTLYMSKLVLTPGQFGLPTWFTTSAAANLFAPLTALLLLFLGITLSMQLAPAGASGIIDKGKKWGTGIGKFAGKRAATFARNKIGDQARGWADKQALSANPQWGQGMGKMGAPLRGIAALSGFGKRAMGQGAKGILSEQGDVKEAEDRVKTAKNAKDLASMYQQEGSKAGKAKILAYAIQKKWIGDMQDENIMGGKKNVITTEDAKEAHKKLRALGDSDGFEGLERAFVKDRGAMAGFAKNIQEQTKNYKPEDQADENGLTAKDRAAGYKSLAEKTVAEAKSADDIKQLQKGWEKEEPLMEIVHARWKGNQAQQAAMNIGPGFVDRLEETKHEAQWYYEQEEIKDNDGKGTGRFKPRNSGMAEFLASTSAKGLGIAPAVGGETTNDLKTLRTEALKKGAAMRAPTAAGITQEETELQSINTELGGDLKQKTDELTQQLTNEQGRARREAQNNPALRGNQKAVNQAVSNDPMVRAVQAELKSLRTRQQTLATRKFQLEKDAKAKQDALRDTVSYDDLVKEEQTEQQRLKAVTEDIEKKRVDVERIKQTTLESDPERMGAEKDLADLQKRKTDIENALQKLAEAKQKREAKRADILSESTRRVAQAQKLYNAQEQDGDTFELNLAFPENDPSYTPTDPNLFKAWIGLETKRTELKNARTEYDRESKITMDLSKKLYEAQEKIDRTNALDPAHAELEKQYDDILKNFEPQSKKTTSLLDRLHPIQKEIEDFVYAIAHKDKNYASADPDFSQAWKSALAFIETLEEKQASIAQAQQKNEQTTGIIQSKRQAEERAELDAKIKKVTEALSKPNTSDLPHVERGTGHLGPVSYARPEKGIAITLNEQYKKAQAAIETLKEVQELLKKSEAKEHELRGRLAQVEIDLQETNTPERQEILTDKKNKTSRELERVLRDVKSYKKGAVKELDTATRHRSNYERIVEQGKNIQKSKKKK